MVLDAGMADKGASAGESMALGERGIVFLSSDEFFEFLNSRISTGH